MFDKQEEYRMYRRRIRKGRDEACAVIAITILLIIMAAGNPKVIFGYSVTGFIVGLAVFRGRVKEGGLFVAMMSLAAGSVIGAFMVYIQSQ